MFSVGPDGTHLGVMTFATKTKIHFDLGKYNDEATLLKEIDKISQLGGGELFRNNEIKR